MTDRALSPIDWSRARKVRAQEGMEGKNEGWQAVSVLQLTSHTSSAGLEVERVLMGMGGTGIEGFGSFAQMHTHVHTHSSYPTKARWWVELCWQAPVKGRRLCHMQREWNMSSCQVPHVLNGWPCNLAISDLSFQKWKKRGHLKELHIINHRNLLQF